MGGLHVVHDREVKTGLFEPFIFSSFSSFYQDRLGTNIGKGTQKQTVLLQELRASLGLCPQFDVLYDEMTAGQQLMLYGCMAGA